VIKAVIFDMDGVIVDTEPLHIKAEKETLKKHGVKVSALELRKYTGTTAKFEFAELIRKYEMNATVGELFNEKEKILFKLLEEDLRPTRGIIELINSLRQQGVKLAIASSAHRKLIKYVLGKLGITHLFDSIVTAEDISRSKPDPEIFMKSANKLGVRPAECVVIEDAKLGVIAAKKAGMKCVGYLNPHSGCQDLSKADRIIDNFAKLNVEELLSFP
jgi:beta-phosphoglucomutase family hydrolase